MVDTLVLDDCADVVWRSSCKRREDRVEGHWSIDFLALDVCGSMQSEVSAAQGSALSVG